MKMKALIVEDELLARVGMRSLLPWEELGIALLEDACDGREALQQIESGHPDLMFLDLNIPEISGLELLKIIRSRHLSVKTIVVSCYDDFDTVKEAMKLGAVDYIRKFGLSKEELLASLKHLRDSFPEMEVEEKSVPEQKSAAQTGYEMRKRVRNIPEEFQSGCCLSFYMVWKYAEEMTDMKLIETVAIQYYQGLGKHTLALMWEGKLLVLIREGTEKAEVESLKRQIELFITNRCYIGITPYSDRDHETGFFTRLADSIEAYGFYGNREEIVDLETPFTFEKHQTLGGAEYMERLERAIQKMSLEEMDKNISELFDEIETAENYPVPYIKRLMIEILSRFSDKSAQLGGSIDELEVADSRRHYRKIVNMANLEDLRIWWKEFTKQFAGAYFTRQKKSESDIIEMALNYIEQNLSSPIQLTDVARYIGVSEPYLSSFFKRVMNENFIPYVNRQKIRRAKQLLAEGKMVYQVSDLLGYENSTYFSKVFKKVEGMTPEQYRKSL